MPYNKTVWVSNDLITADKLNNIENGIENLSDAVGNTSSGSLNSRIQQNSESIENIKTEIGSPTQEGTIYSLIKDNKDEITIIDNKIGAADNPQTIISDINDISNKIERLTANTGVSNTTQVGVDLKTMIDAKYGTVSSEIENLSNALGNLKGYKGLYDSGTQYSAGDTVSYSDNNVVKYYLNIADSTGIVPTNTSYWQECEDGLITDPTIHIGDEEPSDTSIKLWINTDEENGQISYTIPTMDEFNEVVKISDTQPESEYNKLWFTPNGTEVEVPTMEEFNDVNKSYRYSTPLIFNEWEQGSLNYSTGVETISTTACRTVFYYEPRENTTVSIYNPDGNVIGTRKYNAKTGEYISASTITNNSVVVLERGYKYRLVCTNTGNPESITATFSYNSAFSAEDMVGKLDTYTSVSDYVRTQNLVVNALFSKHEESGLSIQREGFSGIKLVGTLNYEAFTYFTIGSVSITEGETYTIYVKSKNGLDNSKIYVSLESIPGVAYNFGMGTPLVFTATATNATARVRAWVGDPSYANGYPIDDVWYVYVVPGVHSLAEFEGNRVVTEKLTVCTWNIGLYNYGRSRADYPATAQMDMMRESLVRKFLTDLYPDVICCTEFYNLDLNHDGDDSDSRSDFELIYPYYYKTDQYMVASKYPIVNASYTEYTSQDPNDSLKKGWVVFDLLLNGKTVKIVNTHATAYARNASIRANQFQQLLSNAIPATSDRVIVLGDFNTQSASELEIFSESGYTLLNGGYSGDYYTQPAINPINPYDNIIIKGMHGVGCVYNQIYEADHADDVDYYVSDHLPLIGKLIIS